VSLVRSNGFTVTVDEGCTACGACLVTCPERALLAAPKRPATIDSRCTGCLACIEICPRDALTVEPLSLLGALVAP